MRADVLSAGCALAAGYLIGGIPFGYIIARARGVDIRAMGSGNVGATNVGRALGRGWGLVTLALDIAKGFLPVFFLAPVFTLRLRAEDPEHALAAMGMGAILGHVFTPYLRFRGGKGVATSIGVFAALLHYWMALPLGAYVLARKLTGYVSAGSIMLAALLPVAAAASKWNDLASAWPRVAFAALAGALILLRHRENISRLARGEELAAAKGAGPGASAHPTDRPVPGGAGATPSENDAKE